MQKFITILLVACFISKSSLAGNPDDSTKLLEAQLKLIDSIERNLTYKTGKVDLSNGIASINVPPAFKFLGPDDANYIITEVWGNPAGMKPLGMIVPANEPASMCSYAFVVEYEEMGYVKDNDADKINYDDMLKEIKSSQEAANIERKKLGLEAMTIVGWASRPFYDKEKKVLHWAKEFKVEGTEENTLNYDIRILGRRGVLNMQAVAGMTSFDSVKNHIGDVLTMVSFNPGNKYSDFNSKTDKVAAWTVGGLVAGKILAKAGFWAIIAKSFKFIIAGIAIAGGAIWRFITGRRKRKEEDEYVYQPQPRPADDDANG